MYINLEQYLDMGGRRITDTTAFERCEAKARAYVDFRTQNRVIEQTEALMRLMVELIDLEASQEDIERNIKSVSNDGVSVTYTDNDASSRSYDYDREQLVCIYMGKLAWRGVD